MKRNTVNLPQTAIAEAITALTESDQFVLICAKEGEGNPEILGFGGIDSSFIESLEIATQYLTGELQELKRCSDVTQLTALMCKN